ncbi:MAG: ribonuclease catalytic domain-containing protein [Desulfobacterota bacterium]|nr:ribonuclease catalytic domain-containing protein [Thermodesulfobacteriota bacterium]
MMYRGKLILFFEHKELVLGVCIAEHTNTLSVLLGNGMLQRLATNRILCASEECIDHTVPQTELLKTLQMHTEAQRKLQCDVIPERLWNSLNRTGETYTLSDLTCCVFGQPPTFDHQCAVLRALASDNIYFKLCGAHVYARTPEEAAARRQKAQEEQKRALIIAEGSEWLASVRNRNPKTCCRVAPVCIDVLKSVAVAGKNSSLYAPFREMLTRAGLTDAKQCFDLLVQLGIWDEDENLLPDRYDIPWHWSDELTQQAEAVVADTMRRVLNDPVRTDLTGLDIFSIDDPYTKDIDDALSLHFDKDTIVLGVHIADVASCIMVGSDLDREAARRGTTIYFPEGKIPLLPQVISEQAVSLHQGVERPAISFLIRLSRDGEIRDIQCFSSVIRVSRRVCYDEVDAAVTDDSIYARFYELTCRLRSHRRAAGAILVPLPELQVRVDAHKNISVRMRDKETAGQIIVSECMILANYCAATLLKKAGYAALYRRHTIPDSSISPIQIRTRADAYRLRHYCNRVMLSTKPGPHAALGLPWYLTVTSPMRKYIDLVNQRQLSCGIRNAAPCYSFDQLQEIMQTVQPVLTRAAFVAQERKKYWILKMLQRRIGEHLDAVVLKPTRRGYLLLLTEYLLEAEAPSPPTTKFTPGDAVFVILRQVEPFYGVMKLELIG